MRRRTSLGGLYSIPEIYMLSDISPDFCDSCALDDRRKGASDENIQGSTYLSVPAGARICEESFRENSTASITLLTGQYN